MFIAEQGEISRIWSVKMYITRGVAAPTTSLTANTARVTVLRTARRYAAESTVWYMLD